MKILTKKTPLLLIALPLLLVAPVASAAITVINNAVVASTTNSSQHLSIAPNSTDTNGTVVQVEAPVNLAAGNYSFTIDANFSVKPQNGLGIRFDSIDGNDDSTIWSLGGVNTGEWNTYTVDFTVDAIGDNEGGIEFRLANSNAQGNQSPFLVDNYFITLDGGGVVFSEDFEAGMVGDPANTTNVALGNASGQIAAVPETSSALLLGSAALLGLIRRRR